MRSAVFCLVLVLGGLLAPPAARAAAPPVAAPIGLPATGYRVSDTAIWNYFQQHGGVQGLGMPISNVFALLGSRVQIFERQAVEVRVDGSVGTLNLADGSYFPLARLGGATLAPDPDLLAHLPAPGGSDYSQRASAYLDATAPAEWNGLAVQFGAAFRSSVRCLDPGGSVGCDDRTSFARATELWGLPIGRPTPDPRNPDYVYLWCQRGVLVYSRTAHDTQWLLVGELFKRVLQGSELPPDMLAQISASAKYSRFYAQSDPLAANGLARPSELPATSLVGAFESPANPAGPVQPLPSSAQTAPAPAATPPRPIVPMLDPRFGVAEGFRAPALMSELHAGWERVVVPWDQIQPDGPADFSHLGLTLSAGRLSADVASGVRVAGVLQFTPGWAQANPSVGQRSVPKNLDLPVDDPANFWGRFVYETVKHYAGQIDEWVIWNEPEFRVGDTASGMAYNWAGTDEEFAQLMRIAYLAAHKANPAVVVSFPATSYWVEELSRPKRTPFYERELAILGRDPHAAEHAFYHDAVALNLYRSPDDVYRVHQIFTAIQQAFNIDKPIWLTEMNAMATDDPQTTCPVRDQSASVKTTLDQQAAYVVQGFALAAAAGYQRAEFYKMVDDESCVEPKWGMVRNNGTHRPVADAARTAITYFSRFNNARFVPLSRAQEAWVSWPANPASYLPNWQTYQVAFDRPGDQRVTALWSGDGAVERVRIPKYGPSARLVDTHDGQQRPMRAEAGSWVVDLPAATAHFALDDLNKDPEGYHVIGGDPLLIIEEGVDPSSPVLPPRVDGT